MATIFPALQASGSAAKSPEAEDPGPTLAERVDRLTPLWLPPVSVHIDTDHPHRWEYRPERRVIVVSEHLLTKLLAAADAHPIKPDFVDMLLAHEIAHAELATEDDPCSNPLADPFADEHLAEQCLRSELTADLRGVMLTLHAFPESFQSPGEALTRMASALLAAHQGITTSNHTPPAMLESRIDLLNHSDTILFFSTYQQITSNNVRQDTGSMWCSYHAWRSHHLYGMFRELPDIIIIESKIHENIIRDDSPQPPSSAPCPPLPTQQSAKEKALIATQRAADALHQRYMATRLRGTPPPDAPPHHLLLFTSSKHASTQNENNSPTSTKTRIRSLHHPESISTLHRSSPKPYSPLTTNNPSLGQFYSGSLINSPLLRCPPMKPNGFHLFEWQALRTGTQPRPHAAQDLSCARSYPPNAISCIPMPHRSGTNGSPSSTRLFLSATLSPAPACPPLRFALTPHHHIGGR